MPKYTQPRKTWQYSKEFKVKAVQLSLIEGIQVQEVANVNEKNIPLSGRQQVVYGAAPNYARLRQALCIISNRRAGFVSDKRLSTRISAYKEVLASGEIQKTYQDLVGIIKSLRTEFSKRYQGEFTVANVLHGYLDFTYFYLQNDFLKKRQLKLAIVLNHRQAHFELWLLGQTKDVQIRYWEMLKGVKWVNPEIMPEYSVFDLVLLAHPDFDDAKQLSESVHRAFGLLWLEIFNTLKASG